MNVNNLIKKEPTDNVPTYTQTIISKTINVRRLNYNSSYFKRFRVLYTLVAFSLKQN